MTEGAGRPGTPGAPDPGPAWRWGEVNWPSLVKRYVWDDDKTPYLVRPERLTATQARNELFVYAVLLSILAAGLTLVAAVAHARLGPVAAASLVLYGLALAVGAIALGVTGHPAAALACASGPVVMAIAALAGGLRPAMSGAERVVLTAVAIVWLGYAARVVRIARRLHGRE